MTGKDQAKVCASGELIIHEIFLLLGIIPAVCGFSSYWGLKERKGSNELAIDYTCQCQKD